MIPGSFTKFAFYPETMIKHIVFLSLLNEMPAMEKAIVLAEVRSKLLELPSKIPGISFFDVGINLSSDPKAADLVILSEFENTDTLNDYLVHPAHQAFIAWNRDKCPKSTVVDYEF